MNIFKRAGLFLIGADYCDDCGKRIGPFSGGGAWTTRRGGIVTKIECEECYTNSIGVTPRDKRNRESNR